MWEEMNEGDVLSRACLKNLTLHEHWEKCTNLILINNAKVNENAVKPDFANI